jgi:hypothetical protein
MRSGGISTPCPFLSLWAFLFRQRNPHRRDRNAPVFWDLIRRTRAGEPSRSQVVGSASLQDDHRVVSTEGTARSSRAAALTPERKSRHPTDIAPSECAFMAEGAVCISRGRGAGLLKHRKRRPLAMEPRGANPRGRVRLPIPEAPRPLRPLLRALDQDHDRVELACTRVGVAAHGMRDVDDGAAAEAALQLAVQLSFHVGHARPGHSDGFYSHRRRVCGRTRGPAPPCADTTPPDHGTRGPMSDRAAVVRSP